MKKPLIPLLSLVLVSLQSCYSVSSVSYESNNPRTGVLLAENGDASIQRSWRVFPGREESQPRIQVSTTASEDVPDLGLSVSSLTAEQAQVLGREPFSAVVITQIDAEGAGSEVPLGRGDLITKVAGRAVTTPEQFAFVISEEAQIDQPLSLTVVPRRRSGDDDAEGVVIELTPKAVRAVESSSESIPLQRSDGVLKYLGLEVAMIESWLAKQIYGTAEPVPVVTGVYTGSPAYFAGLRCGDRILSVDGDELNSLQPLKDTVLAMVRREAPSAPILDLRDPAGVALPVASEDKEKIFLAVDSVALGPHLAILDFDIEYDENTDFTIPILFNYESSRTYSESGFLNFIFTFGYDTWSRYSPSATREPVERSHTRVLPLGLIDVESGPYKTEWTVLWFIKWEVRN